MRCNFYLFFFLSTFAKFFLSKMLPIYIVGVFQTTDEAPYLNPNCLHRSSTGSQSFPLAGKDLTVQSCEINHDNVSRYLTFPLDPIRVTLLGGSSNVLVLLLYACKIQDLLFISYKFVKGFLTITFLLLLISIRDFHMCHMCFLCSQKRNFSWIRRKKRRNFPIDPHWKKCSLW